MVGTISRPGYRSSPSQIHEHRSLDVLYEAGKILAGPVDPEQMLSSVLRVLSSFMGLRCGAVALLVDPRHPLASAAVNPYVIAATWRAEEAQPASCGAIPEAVAAMVLRTGIATVVQNVRAELGEAAIPRDIAAEAPVALIAAPILERDPSPTPTGVLCAYRVFHDGEPWELDLDLRLLKMVAALVSQSLRFRRIVLRDRERLLAQASQAAKALKEVRVGGAVEADGIGEIIGESAEIRAVYERVRKVAPTRATVLLRGESGTGKELFARAIHRLSDRSDRPFVKLNCAALSETLLESELFGHEKGSFTGAMGQKKGRFELADGGTLFLDEIGEISSSFQAKLLRALQEGEFERVGGTRTVKVDVRLVAATNRDLEEAVTRGEFRADLYFRICVIPIVLPPLRERPGDIPRLAQAFLDRFNQENGASLRFGRAVLGLLQACSFPGNVRELENCVSRAAALTAGPVIEAIDMACQQDACLSPQLWRLRAAGRAPVGGLGSVPLPVFNDAAPRAPQPPAAPPLTGAAPSAAPAAAADHQSQPPRSQREELIDAMQRSGWVQAKAARLLGMTPRQIGYALKKHGIDVVRF
ncbi:nif-specific transcriptional activator NifA [Consotaella salsifontis]|uniref:Nif-specific regulatory protein n=1 Tax=Consotaella salsifontis TaxID=1365950 RepID=A0A1T4S8I7_9HYPH|nr:nif-specific transcriptional activator NifA [Consotaella salsifontis]SKA24545.1 Nif-specific regulatory protein [Consotaella salsifontis]